MDGAHRMVFDPLDADEGPLGGIVRCSQTTDMPLLVLAVDMPQITAGFLLDRLLAHSQVVTKVASFSAALDGFEPLAAIYTPAMLLSLSEAASESGRLGLRIPYR